MSADVISDYVIEAARPPFLSLAAKWLCRPALAWRFHADESRTPSRRLMCGRERSTRRDELA